MNTWIDGEPVIPEISDEEIADGLRRWTPLVLREGVLYKIELPDPRRTAFTWDPKLAGQVTFEELGRIKTEHTCNYHGFFKPSLAEVLAQLPKPGDRYYVPEANAFYIDTGAAISIEIFRSGLGHRAVTILGRLG